MTVTRPTNCQRATQVRRALEVYKARMLREECTVGMDDLTDLLTDLRHLWALEGWNLADAIAMSKRHFREEWHEAAKSR